MSHEPHPFMAMDEERGTPYVRISDTPDRSATKKNKWDIQSLEVKLCSCKDNFVCSYSLPVVLNKGTALTLMWNALVFGYQFLLLDLFYSTDVILFNSQWATELIIVLLQNGVSSMLYPFAGWLADSHFGRYKVISYSILLMWSGCLIVLVEVIVSNLVSDSEQNLIEIPLFLVVLCVNTVSLAGFNANIIPFMIDQTPDASTEQLKSLIRWYYWTRNFGFIVLAVVNFSICFADSRQTLLSLPITIIVSAVMLSFAACSDIFLSHKWLVTNQKKTNPFKYVAKILGYSLHHKQPVMRSAFTYNPEFNPSRLDYAKDIYGGPYSFEEVEDVKTFLNMMKILSVFGGFVILQESVNISSSIFLNHLDVSTGLTNSSCYPNDSVYYLFNPPIIVVSLLIFEFLMYPFLKGYFFSTLKRIGAGVFLTLASLSSFLVMVLFGEYASGGKVCIFNGINESSFQLPVSSWVLLLPIALSTVAEMLGIIGGFEFICAQSPYNLSGFMIGMFYFINGIFTVLAIAIIVPFTASVNFGWCGPAYYITIVVVGCIAFLLFTVVARVYKQRERDHVINQQRLVEDVYEREFDERERLLQRERALPDLTVEDSHN